MSQSKFNFEAAIEMLRSLNGQLYEDGYQWLIGYVDQNLDELIKLLRHEQDPTMRGRFVEIVGHSKNSKVLSLLQEELKSPHMEVRKWAYSSLQMFPDTTKLLRQFALDHPDEDYL
jgi:hypothetical protein